MSHKVYIYYKKAQTSVVQMSLKNVASTLSSKGMTAQTDIVTPLPDTGMANVSVTGVRNIGDLYPLVAQMAQRNVEMGGWAVLNDGIMLDAAKAYPQKKQIPPEALQAIQKSASQALRDVAAWLLRVAD